METGKTETMGDPCTDPTCKVAFWTVIERRAWQGRARNLADARIALGSAELVCAVFHKRDSKLCTCRLVAVDAPGFEHRGTRIIDVMNCLVHDPTRAHEAARVRAKLIETTQRAGI